MSRTSPAGPAATPVPTPAPARRRAGFTLIEVLIVLVVIGIITAIAIPNLLSAAQRGKQKRTMEDMRAVGTACALYAMDHDAQIAQPSEVAIGGIAGHLEPTYLRLVPDRDGWGANLLYVGDGSTYTLTSLGRDRTPGGNGTIGADGTTTDFDADMLFSDGSFSQLPEGVQR